MADCHRCESPIDPTQPHYVIRLTEFRFPPGPVDAAMLFRNRSCDWEYIVCAHCASFIGAAIDARPVFHDGRGAKFVTGPKFPGDDDEPLKLPTPVGPEAFRSPDPARRCTRCQHLECPCCPDWCDDTECACADEMRCSYTCERSAEQLAWLDQFNRPGMSLGNDPEGHFVAHVVAD